MKEKNNDKQMQKNAGMNKGLAIGMVICVAIGIVLSEFGGFHNILTWSIIFGSAVGIIIGSILEMHNKKIVTKSYQYVYNKSNS